MSCGLGGSLLPLVFSDIPSIVSAGCPCRMLSPLCPSGVDIVQKAMIIDEDAEMRL